MTDKKETGGPAFPLPNVPQGGPAFPLPNVPQSWASGKGMTLRDYFAAQAMQGMLAACSGWSEGQQERLAKCSYAMADKMIKARTE